MQTSVAMTDVGRVRKVNQDYVYASDTPVGNLPNLYIVADGMGGHKAGDLASSYAVQTIVEAISRSVETRPALILQKAIRYANIGDSRLYEISQKQIRQISEDHSLVAELVRKGELSATEARRHPDKNIITRALGIQDEAQIDLFPFRVETGNRYLLCSDGLTNMVEDTELCRLISQKKDISEIGAELILKANKNGGLDNIAVVLVEIDNSEVGL